MGEICCKKAQISGQETEEDITVPTYESLGDEEYSKLEHQINYLQKISVIEYLYSLVNFSNETSTKEDDYSTANIEYSMNNDFYKEELSDILFQSFLENKLLKHKAIIDEASANDEITSIFKDMLMASYNGLALKLYQNAKEKGDESANKSTIVKKSDVLSYGILYCSGSNITKIHILFNLFNSNGIIKISEQFSNFLLSLFLLASYGMANARNKTSKYEVIGGIDSTKLKEIINVSELQDSQHLVDETNKMIFGDDLSASLTYEQFKSKFAKSNKKYSIGFLLSASGVRYMLQQKNV